MASFEINSDPHLATAQQQVMNESGVFTDRLYCLVLEGEGGVFVWVRASLTLSLSLALSVSLVRQVKIEIIRKLHV